MKSYLLSLLALTICVAGCGPEKNSGAPNTAVPVGKPATATPSKPEGPLKVAFVTNNASVFWTIAKAGTEKAKAEFGCDVLFRIPAAGTAQEQQTILQDLITVGVSGIAISPVTPKDQTEMLNEAASHVNLVTQDSDAADSNRKCYIGTNNLDAGKAAGELIKKNLPNGGKIVLFVGMLEAQNAQDRKKGIELSLAGSGIEVIDTRTDGTDRAKAIANVQDTLTAHPDVACLVGLWSYNGPAILNGVRDSNKLGQVKIVCFDEEPETLQGVKDGHIAGTIVQQPFEFGYQSVKLLVQLGKGDSSAVPSSKQIFIPVRTITQTEVDAFWADLRAQTGMK